MNVFGLAHDLRRPDAVGHRKVAVVKRVFDLVFVFATAQLSYSLLCNVSFATGMQIGLLLLALLIAAKAWRWPLGVAGQAVAMLFLVTTWEPWSLQSGQKQVSIEGKR